MKQIRVSRGIEQASAPNNLRALSRPRSQHHYGRRLQPKAICNKREHRQLGRLRIAIAAHMRGLAGPRQNLRHQHRYYTGPLSCDQFSMRMRLQSSLICTGAAA